MCVLCYDFAEQAISISIQSDGPPDRVVTAIYTSRNNEDFLIFDDLGGPAVDIMSAR